MIDPGDVDYVARVEAHRSRRPTAWATIDAGSDLAGPLAQIEGTVLVDALGTWGAASNDFTVDPPSSDPNMVGVRAGRCHPGARLGALAASSEGATAVAIATTAGAGMLGSACRSSVGTRATCWARPGG